MVKKDPYDTEELLSDVNKLGSGVLKTFGRRKSRGRGWHNDRYEHGLAGSGISPRAGGKPISKRERTIKPKNIPKEKLEETRSAISHFSSNYAVLGEMRDKLYSGDISELKKKASQDTIEHSVDWLYENGYIYERTRDLIMRELNNFRREINQMDEEDVEYLSDIETADQYLGEVYLYLDRAEREMAGQILIKEKLDEED